MEKFDMAKFLADSGVGVNAEHREQIEYIRLDLIDGDPNNFYQLSGIEDLAANISLCGLQQPVRVREKPEGRYVVVSGHRRRAALELLAKDDPEHWQEIPCIVERDAVSPALQQLRLIYANANTRAMTSAELGEQAAQVEKLLYQLKDEGYEFPGRMRDHVAQAVNASKTKLARLKVIRGKLIPQFMRMWEKGELNDSVAYALAGQVPVRQRYVYSCATNEGKSNLYLSADTLNYRFNIMNEIQKKCDTLSCKTGEKCGHSFIRMQQVADHGYVQCSGCCVSCACLLDCKFNCPNSADEKSRLKAKAKLESSKEIQKKREERRPAIDILSVAYGRVSQLRKERNISAEDIVKASLGFAYDRCVKRMNDIEGGKKPSVQDRMPGGIWADEAIHLIAVADLLGCSIDYLLGRDENVSKLDTKLLEVNVSDSDTWHTGEPPEPGEYVVVYEENTSTGTYTESQTDKWDGVRWRYIDSSGADIVAWAYLPTVQQSPLNNSCITGMSPSGHCGAAAYCNSDVDCCLQCDQECNGRCGWIEKEENNAKMQ